MTTLHLNPDEAQFLYRVLDQVNVSGPQAKALLLSIMVALTSQPPSALAAPAEEGKTE